MSHHAQISSEISQLRIIIKSQEMNSLAYNKKTFIYFFLLQVGGLEFYHINYIVASTEVPSVRNYYNQLNLLHHLLYTHVILQL